VARPKTQTPAKSTERGRRHREREKRGVENFSVDARSDWRDILIRFGHLDAGAVGRCGSAREERKLVGQAFGEFLDVIHDRSDDESISTHLGRVRLDPRRAM
jgi:hypothetical protein